MKFYPRDWRGDQALRAVSLAARGLWIECLCIMHEAKPYGHLLLNGAPVDGDTLARMTGVPVDEVSALLAELRQAGVLSMTGKGVVFSRRMTKDHARAQKGRKAANKRWSQASDGVEQSEGPNRSSSSSPTTQKPEARSQKDIEPIAQRTEPLRAPDLVDRLFEAAGIRGNPSPAMAFPGPIFTLIDAGYDVDRDILDGLRSKPNPNARSWTYFVPQLEEYRKRRLGMAERKAPDPADKLASWPVDRWQLVLDQFRASGEWQRQTYGPRPGEPGCRVPPELLSRAA